MRGRDGWALAIFLPLLVALVAWAFLMPPARSYDAEHGVMCYRAGWALSCVKTEP